MNIQSINGTVSLTTPAPSSANGEPATAKNSSQSVLAVSQSSAPLTTQFVNASDSADKSRQPDREELQDAARRISDFVSPLNDSIQFSVDDKSGRMVIKVIDSQTDEVLRQIPSEEALSIASALDKLQGLLIKSQA